MAGLLLERSQNDSWIVVFKALISTHTLMNYGSEVCHQIASGLCVLSVEIKVLLSYRRIAAGMLIFFSLSFDPMGGYVTMSMMHGFCAQLCCLLVYWFAARLGG